ncbi:MAG TPA: hypothetical protein PKH39_08615 [Woeseiaceae bacterium]|nr:hypothetical protein [Woeseiaceae bacterium]
MNRHNGQTVFLFIISQLATRKFEGNLADSGGNGYEGTAFGRKAKPAVASFGEGIKTMPAKDNYLDEVQIYGRAMNKEEIGHVADAVD